MSVRLHHPVTGGQFDAAESALPQWRRAGWVPAAELEAAAQATDKPASNGAGTGKAAGKAGVAAKPNEE